jgi:hypothetical protein
MQTTSVWRLNKMAHPSFGWALTIRGLDMFDTPPVALGPLFAHEPLLRGVTSISEPFCGRGNLVTAMRARGLTVHASDIFPRGCPDSAALDFFDMTAAPCPVLVSNPPYSQATALLEHAFAIGFRVVIFLLTTNYLHTGDRRERIHKRGNLVRVHVLAERLQGMHEGAHLAAGGKKASQPQVHSWFVFNQAHYGPQPSLPCHCTALTRKCRGPNPTSCPRSCVWSRSTDRLCATNAFAMPPVQLDGEAAWR